MILAVAFTTASAAPNDAPLGPDAIEVVCQIIDGRSINANLIDFDVNTRLMVESHHAGDPLTIATEDLVRLEFGERSRPDPSAAVVELANGDRVYGRVIDGGDETLVVENELIERMVIPLAAVRMVRTASASDLQWRQRVTDLAASPNGGMDRLLMSNGDVLEGLIAAVDRDSWTVEVAGDQRRMDAALIIAAQLQPLPAEPPTGLHARIQLEDGSRLTATSLHVTPSTEAKCVCHGQPNSLDPRTIRRIDVRGGRWAPLTDLTPSQYEHTPMMSVGWDYRVNANVTGGPLRVAGRSFDEGIGVHSRSLLRYELAGRYREFATQFGFDDTAGDLAHVNIEIRVDGRTVLESEVAGGDGLHEAVRIPVAGADRLELLVDFGKNAAVQDRFNWIEPALVR
jgi:ribosome maturation factor RimP